MLLYRLSLRLYREEYARLIYMKTPLCRRHAVYATPRCRAIYFRAMIYGIAGDGMVVSPEWHRMHNTTGHAAYC